MRSFATLKICSQVISPGVRCLVPAYMQKIEEALKSDKVKIDREYFSKDLESTGLCSKEFHRMGRQEKR